jgi:hypothetical protein
MKYVLYWKAVWWPASVWLWACLPKILWNMVGPGTRSRWGIWVSQNFQNRHPNGHNGLHGTHFSSIMIFMVCRMGMWIRVRWGRPKKTCQSRGPQTNKSTWKPLPTYNMRFIKFWKPVKLVCISRRKKKRKIHSRVVKLFLERIFLKK